MSTVCSKMMGMIAMLGLSASTLAQDGKSAPPQEPAGFVAGGVIGALAAGPLGAVIGAGLGTWLGNRVHRAGEAAAAEAEAAAAAAKVAALQGDNRSLSGRIDELSAKVEAAQRDQDHAALALDGLQGDVLFRTASAQITPEMAHQIQTLALAVAKSPALKVRVDGYADPRGTVDTNFKLSAARANAVRDLFLAAGLRDAALEVNAYGKSQSVAADNDGYALERRVRLTLQAADGAALVSARTEGLR